MSDPTQHATPGTPASEGRRRWLPTYQQLRLFVLLAALTVGITGMTRGDSRLVNAGIFIAMAGVIMRFFNRKRPPSGER